MAAVVGSDVAACWIRGPSALAWGVVPASTGRMPLMLAVTVALVVGGAVLRGARWSTATVAGCVLAFLLANGMAHGSGDTTPATYLPFVLWREHTVSFASVAAIHGPNAYYLNAHELSAYPLATGLLALPIYVPALVGTFAVDDPHVVSLGRIAAAVLTTLGALLMWAVFRRVLQDERRARVALAVYIAGTAVLPILAQALWQHTGAVLGLSLAVYALFAEDDPWRRGLLAGLGAGVAIAARSVDVVLAAGVLLAVMLRSRRSVLTIIAGALVPLALLTAYNWHYFGGPFASGYGTQASSGFRTGTPLQGALGILVSPARGLLVFSPIFLFAALWRAPRAVAPPVWRALSLSVLAFAAVMASWVAWHGGYSVGPRMLSDTFPLLAPLTAVGAWRAWDRRRWRGVLIACVALSVLTQALLVFTTPSPAGRSAAWYLSEGPWSWRAYPPLGYLSR